ncbi:hypothetical protein PRUPE_3G220200 [Prunus persica]|uniref:Uncharacterized protein n=2 Tax=Prunus persica TaxID=3760 RepID=A0A251Q3Z3_PRUPE|nr:uncharacterized protein LOC109947798 isoform X1 [Prunus persica]ONI18514.1 hypothetical protein PRUPE_3G220200 [Prunus persica]
MIFSTSVALNYLCLSTSLSFVSLLSSLHMEGECSMLVKQETSYKSVFIVAQHFGRLYEGVLYEVKIEQGSGAIIRGGPGRALVGEEDRPPLLNPVNKIFGESDMVKPYSCRLVALRFNGLSKLYMLLTARDVLRHSLRSTTTAPTKPDLKGRIFDIETKSFYAFTHPKSFNRRSTLMSAYNKLYHLGIADSWSLNNPRVAFERYDPCNDCWEPLPSVPFGLYKGRGGMAGYAVCGNNILLSSSAGRSFIAFNVKEKKWYPVLAKGSFSFRGRAVVVGNTIYCLLTLHHGMVAKFSFDPSTYSISGSQRLYGLEYNKKHTYNGYFEQCSEYMVHLGNLDFCLVQSGTDSNCCGRQPIWITTFQIVSEGGKSSINTLHSTVYDVDLNGAHKFLIGFSFTPDCEDNEPKGIETKVKLIHGPLEKRCKRKGHYKLGIKRGIKLRTKRTSRKSFGLCLKRGLITLGKL